MADSVRIKRGIRSNLPKSLPLGELAFCTDTGELFVGAGEGHTLKKVVDPDVIHEQKKLNEQLDNIEKDKANKNEVRENTYTKPINYSEMDTETRKLFTGGAVAVVGVNSVGKENLLNKSVEVDKTDFLNRISINLFNKNDIFYNKIIDSNGNLEDFSDDLVASNFIEVISGSVMSFNHCGFIAEYDNNKTFIIRHENVDVYKKITLSPTTKYVRTNIMNFNIDNAMVYLSEIQLDYVQYYNRVEMQENIKVTIKNIDNNIITQKKLSFIKDNPINKIDMNEITDNHYINNGELISYEPYFVTDFIEVEEYKQYIHDSEPGFACIYDKNKMRISEDNYASNKFSIPQGGKYLRCSIKKKDSSQYMLVEGDTIPSTYIPYSSQYVLEDCKINYKDILNPQVPSKWYGKTLAIIGDSITYGYLTQETYHKIIKEEKGLKEVLNYGISGSTIAFNSKEDSNPMSERFSQMGNADIIGVFAGVNDSNWQIPLGTMNDRTNTTFYGACHILFKGLCDKYYDRTIFTINQYPVFSMENREKQIEYVKAYEEVSKFYSIPTLNLFEKSNFKIWNKSFADKYLPDTLHPNEEGYKLLARIISAFMEQL